MIRSLHAAVGRNRNDVEFVDLPEFARLGHGGAGHTTKFSIELEKVLERDGRECLRLFFDSHALFRFDGLMQAVRPLAARHQSAGELVHDHNLIALHHIVDISPVEIVGLERVVDEVRPLHISGGVEALHVGEFFGLTYALFRERDGVLFFLHLKVRLGL